MLSAGFHCQGQYSGGDSSHQTSCVCVGVPFPPGAVVLSAEGTRNKLQRPWRAPCVCWTTEQTAAHAPAFCTEEPRNSEMTAFSFSIFCFEMHRSHYIAHLYQMVLVTWTRLRQGTLSHWGQGLMQPTPQTSPASSWCYVKWPTDDLLPSGLVSQKGEKQKQPRPVHPVVQLLLASTTPSGTRGLGRAAPGRKTGQALRDGSGGCDLLLLTLSFYRQGTKLSLFSGTLQERGHKTQLISS